MRQGRGRVYQFTMQLFTPVRRGIGRVGNSNAPNGPLHTAGYKQNIAHTLSDIQTNTSEYSMRNTSPP